MVVRSMQLHYKAADPFWEKKKKNTDECPQHRPAVQVRETRGVDTSEKNLLGH